jgi:hypothetical protein
MTSLLLDHPLFFSGTLFLLLIIAVEAGFRTAVCGEFGSSSSHALRLAMANPEDSAWWPSSPRS